MIVKSSTDLPTTSKIEFVVEDDLRFKKQLKIGNDAYKILSTAKKLSALSDTVGWGVAGSSVASSTIVASTFFGGNGLLVTLGIISATTPIGWVVGAGIVTTGAAYGFKKLFSKAEKEMVDTIPKYINTPLDLLATKLCELMIPIALKIANADGVACPTELEYIQNHFTKVWGINGAYIKNIIDEIKPNINKYYYSDLCSVLKKFTKDNQDCNYKEICKDIVKLAENIAHADGQLHKKESFEIKYLERKLLG